MDTKNNTTVSESTKAADNDMAALGNSRNVVKVFRFCLASLFVKIPQDHLLWLSFETEDVRDEGTLMDSSPSSSTYPVSTAAVVAPATYNRGDVDLMPLGGQPSPAWMPVLRPTAAASHYCYSQCRLDG
jgi:hypothetical protein